MNTIHIKLKNIIFLISALLISTNVCALNWNGTQNLDVAYKTVDGETLRLDIFLPDTQQPSPVVIYTHGGGWATGTKDSINFGYKSKVAEALLNAGVAVISVQYRLTGDGVIIRDCVTDSKDAVRFIAKNAANYNIDPMKIATFADSAGGHIAMMLGLTSNNESGFPGASELASYNDFLIKGTVAWYGPTSFRTQDIAFWMDRSIYGFDERVFGDETNTTAQEALRALVSPVVYMKSSSAPLYLVHGVDDTTIPVGHVYGMEDQTIYIGNTSFDYQLIQNATHNFLESGTLAISPTSDTIVELTTNKLITYLNTSSSIVHLRKKNAMSFAIDGNNGGENGQDVYLFRQNSGNVNQQWIEIDRGNSYYSLQKNGTNYCLDGGMGGSNRQNVYLWTCKDENRNQHWLKVDLGNGYYRLQKRNAPEFSIDGNNGGANFQSLYLWPSNDTNANQHWHFGSAN